MPDSLREQHDSSQSTFGADLLEVLAACMELINTGRSGSGDGLGRLAAVRDFGRRYRFYGQAATGADLPRLREHRARLDTAAAACEAGDDNAAIEVLNALLTETGAIPQIVAHDGRPPHIHVSRPASPLADRVAAQLAMGLAELIVAGESRRLRSCASPACRAVFIDLSRNRSRRYCDSRTCGNRLHVAAYRARRAGPAGTPDRVSGATAPPARR